MNATTTPLHGGKITWLPGWMCFDQAIIYPGQEDGKYKTTGPE
jgi:hypothetical protein